MSRCRVRSGDMTHCRPGSLPRASPVDSTSIRAKTWHNRVVGQSAWVKTDRSRALSGRRSKDTAPEVALRKALHAAGARFRLHRRIVKGCTPDLVLPGRAVAVFVDGDFWHGCPVHFPDR